MIAVTGAGRWGLDTTLALSEHPIASIAPSYRFETLAQSGETVLDQTTLPLIVV